VSPSHMLRERLRRLLPGGERADERTGPVASPSVDGERRSLLRGAAAAGATAATAGGAVGTAAGTDDAEPPVAGPDGDPPAGVRRAAREQLRAAGETCDRARTDDSGLPWDTGGDYGGWGGAEFFDTEAGVSRPPVVFVHGNLGDACNFRPHAEYLLERGFAGDELWSITFREQTSSHAEMAAQLEAFVGEVRAETRADEVAVVSHSLGVTGTRVWADAYDRADLLDVWIGLAGPNHGVCNCPCCCEATVGDDGPGEPCQFVATACLGVPGHPLYDLNDDETPGNADYYAVRGYYDPLYWCNPWSPYLDGAENELLFTDHMGTLESDETKRLLAEWLP